MYAAAAGASCRNTRKKQALQIVKDKAAEAKRVQDKLDAERGNDVSTPTKSKQFHQLPASYLKPPHARGRKLSTGYTGHSSKLLLPISEQSAHRHSPSQQTLHHHSRHNLHHAHEPRTPTHGPHCHLSKSATASFPLVSHDGSPPASPGVCFRQQQQFFKQSQSNLLSAHHPVHIQIPNDGIIITPATPLPSPSQSNNQKQQHAEQAQQIAQDPDDMPEFPLERACSVYRNRKLEASEKTTTTFNIGDPDDDNQQFYPGAMPNGNGGHHTHWADEYCDCESRMIGDCTCDHIEVKNERALCHLRGPPLCLLCENTIFILYTILINHLHVRFIHDIVKRKQAVRIHETAQTVSTRK